MGGVPAGLLLHFDLAPRGQTLLWGRFFGLLEQLATLIRTHKLERARICGLDLSRSMQDHTKILNRMWSSVPTTGVSVDGIELLIVTDGQDNKSEGKFFGMSGFNELVARAQDIGFSFGCDLDPADPIANVTVVILDISPGGSLGGAAQGYGTKASILCSQDLAVVSRVINQRKPIRLGRGRVTDASALAEVTADEQKLIEVKEQALTRKRSAENLSLQSLIDRRIKTIPEAETRQSCYDALMEFLREVIVDNKSKSVHRRGEKKNRAHSEINHILYALRGWGAMDMNDAASPRVWSRGLMYSFLEEQLQGVNLHEEEHGDIEQRVKRMRREELETAYINLLSGK